MTITRATNGVTVVQPVIDPDIPQLHLALDPSFMRRHLENFVADTDSSFSEIRSLSVAMVRHKPGRRCMIRYDVAHGTPTRRRQISLLGKIRARGLDARTFELCSELWRNGFGPNSTDSVYVPEPFGRVDEIDMWMQRYVPAPPLAERLFSTDAEDRCRLAGTALCKLHTRGPTTRRTHGSDKEAAMLMTRLHNVAPGLAGLGRRIRRVADGCTELLADEPGRTVSPIHRDFYPDQILVSRNSSWIVDLDLYAMGDPALDLGNFVAHLQEFSLRRYGHCHGLTRLEQAFLEGYCSAAGRDLSLSLSIYVTASLARHIAISRQFPDRQHTTEALLALCERRLGLATPRTSAISESAIGIG